MMDFKVSWEAIDEFLRARHGDSAVAWWHVVRKSMSDIQCAYMIIKRCKDEGREPTKHETKLLAHELDYHSAIHFLYGQHPTRKFIIAHIDSLNFTKIQDMMRPYVDYLEGR